MWTPPESTASILDRVHKKEAKERFDIEVSREEYRQVKQFMDRIISL